MELAEALQIVSALADGRHPLTGQPLATDHVCREPQVVRALALIVQRFRHLEPPHHATGAEPENAGKVTHYWQQPDYTLVDGGVVGTGEALSRFEKYAADTLGTIRVLPENVCEPVFMLKNSSGEYLVVSRCEDDTFMVRAEGRFLLALYEERPQSDFAVGVSDVDLVRQLVRLFVASDMAELLVQLRNCCPSLLPFIDQEQ